jgi:hypothetical protein
MKSTLPRIVRHEVVVAQNRRLGGARRAAGEQFDGDAALVIGRVPGQFRPGGEQFGRGDAGHRIADQQGARNARQQRRDLGIGQPVVDRHIGHAGKRRTEQRHRRCRAVDREIGQPCRPCRAHPRRRPPRRNQQFGIGQVMLAMADGDAVAHRIGGHFEQGEQVH